MVRFTTSVVTRVKTSLHDSRRAEHTDARAFHLHQATQPSSAAQRLDSAAAAAATMALVTHRAVRCTIRPHQRLRSLANSCCFACCLYCSFRLILFYKKLSYCRDSAHRIADFRSHDKNGCHTIKSATVEHPILDANIATLC